MNPIVRAVLRSLAVAMPLAGLGPASGQEPGNSVVVVYNQHVPESRGVAEYYAQRRRVPPDHLLGLNLTTNEIISRADFAQDLERPLYDWLVLQQLFTPDPAATNGSPGAHHPLLAASIRYAVLCYGVPLKITGDPKLSEPGASQLKLELQRNDAAVDSELAILPLLGQRPLRAGPMASWVYGETNLARLHPTNGVLLVARLDGPTPEIARGLVDKAMEAETNGWWGCAYFDARGLTNGSYRVGDDWIRAAAAVCRWAGFRTTLDERPETFPAAFPLSPVAVYAGWYDADVSGPFARTTVEFMPGAFAYHLHSFSAYSLRTSTRHWVGPLLAKGATAVVGCVEEPYISGTPNVALLLERLTLQRFTFGEAAAVAQGGFSWQTTVVGDPLYRPFRLPPDLLHHNLERRFSRLAEWSHSRVVRLNLAKGYAPQTLLSYLEGVPLAEHSAVLQEEWGDLLRGLGQNAEAVAHYQRAVMCQPSPQQKVRLLLTAAALLESSGQAEPAYRTYQQLLTECPDYPAPADVHRQLEVLARKLGRTADAERHQAAVRLLSPTPVK